MSKNFENQNHSNTNGNLKNSKVSSNTALYVAIAISFTGMSAESRSNTIDDYCDTQETTQTYQVVSGDTLYTVMRDQFGLDYSDAEDRMAFKQENNMPSPALSVGDELTWTTTETQCDIPDNAYVVQRGDGPYYAMNALGLDYNDSEQVERFFEYNQIENRGGRFYVDGEPMEEGHVFFEPEESEESRVKGDFQETYKLQPGDSIKEAMIGLGMDPDDEEQRSDFFNYNNITILRGLPRIDGEVFQPGDEVKLPSRYLGKVKLQESYEVQHGDNLDNVIEGLGLDPDNEDHKQDVLNYNNMQVVGRFAYYKGRIISPGDLIELPANYHTKKKVKEDEVAPDADVMQDVSEFKIGEGVNERVLSVGQKIYYMDDEENIYDAKVEGINYGGDVVVSITGDPFRKVAQHDQFRLIKDGDAFERINLIKEYKERFEERIDRTLAWAGNESNPIHVPSNYQEKLENELQALKNVALSQVSEQEKREELVRQGRYFTEIIDYPLRTMDLVQLFDDVATMMRIKNARMYFESMDSDTFVEYKNRYGFNSVINMLRLKRTVNYTAQSKNYINQIDGLVEDLFERYNYNERGGKELPDYYKILLVGLIDLESKFNPFNIGQAGELGMAQIMPSNFLAGNAWFNRKEINPFNPEISLSWAITYLNYIYNRFRTVNLGDGGYDLAEMVLTGYNMGPSRVIRGSGQTFRVVINRYPGRVINSVNELLRTHDNIREMAAGMSQQDKNRLQELGVDPNLLRRHY
ncbi:transglycosylase SLT domain-containing protein [Candidatus Absconditicoccus praedator]|uniref:transglycosylase SLT domain-containing protein n=1 Tax=Candidatus Absconditicoccus praedator TaxID=2735562 RepID=UPI001E39256E|nr:transglycosylase SLT domain-containing protein [Candidatus Absconditicoccus praedator]UFX82634.1 transglycosylase SLT domain-containing protein [Candidatus Absconditicoccus praedator]